jgi:uncharacterized RDD family membrane protein YckC
MPPSSPPGYVPYQATAVPNYASFWARLGGYILDPLLYGLVFALFLIPAIILGFQAFKDCTRTTEVNGNTKITCTGDQFNAGFMVGAVLLALIGAVVVAVIYFRQFGRTGQTWGRKIVGVRVVRQHSDAPLGVGLAIGRTILEGILGQACILDYLWMLWDKDKQTWHDKIANTIVIQA